MALNSITPRNRPIATLTFTKSYQLWGGFKLHSLKSSGFKYKDITNAALAVSPDLPITARVATVHISILPPLIKRLRKGQTTGLSKLILASREQLRKHGFTHVALTGPMVVTLNLNKRLMEINRHTNSSALVGFATLNAQLGFYLAWLVFLIAGKPKEQRRAIINAARLSKAGFREYVVYKL